MSDPTLVVRFAIGAATVCVVMAVGFGLFRVYLWLKHERAQSKRTVDTFLRIFPALAEHEQFFKLLELRSGRAHFLERHGPMLRHVDIRQRANTGDMPVSGVVGKPVASARWLKHDDMLWAIESAIQSWESGERPPGGVFKYEFSKLIGEGYVKGSDVLLRTEFAKVVIRDDVVVTAFPLLDSNTNLHGPVSESQRKGANSLLTEADRTDV